MKNRKLLGIALVVALFLALVGCGSNNNPTPSADPAKTDEPAAEVVDTMNIVVTTSPVGLHPLKTNDAPSTYCNGQIFETL